MRYRLLGSLAVERDDGSPVPIAAPKRRALLAILLLQRGRPIQRERLIDALWGDGAPANADEALFAHVSRLRREVGSSVVQTVPGGYVLAMQDEELDIVEFERDVETGRRALSSGQWAVASEAFSRALARWGGAALSEFSGERFAEPEISRLEQLRDTAMEDQIEADLGRGRHIELVPQLEQLVKVHPLRERLWAQLMLALYRSGRQSDALERYQALRRALVDDLGIEPSPDVQHLQARILQQAPDLAAPSAPPLRGEGPDAEVAVPETDFVFQAAARHHRARRRGSGILQLWGIAAAAVVAMAASAFLGARGGNRSEASPSTGEVGGGPPHAMVERILYTAVAPRNDFGCDNDAEMRAMLVAPEGGVPQRVTRGGDVFETEAVWSPDGTQIAFMGRASDRTSLYVMDADGSGLRDLLPSRPPAEISRAREVGLNWMFPLRRPAWAPDGRTIVFNYAQGGVWAVAPDGSDLYQVLPDVRVGEDLGYAFGSVATLPDGRIAVEVTEPVDDAHGWTRLYVAQVDGSGSAPLPGMPDHVSVVGATWASDGTLAFHGEAYVGPGAPSTSDLYVREPGSSSAFVVPGTTGIARAPAWSPDGTRLAFTARGAVHTVNRDGSDRRTIASETEGTACGASWVRTDTALLPHPPTLAPGETPGPVPYHRGFLEPGRYVTELFQPRITFTLGEGWYGNRNSVDSLRIDRATDTFAAGSGYVLVARVQVVTTSPCDAAPDELIGSKAADLIEHVARHRGDAHLDVTAPVPVNVGGRSGLSVDVRMLGSLTDAECPSVTLPFPNFHPLFKVGDRPISLRTGDRMRLVSIDGPEGSPVTFLLVAQTTDFEDFSEVPVATWDAMLDVAQPVLDSLSFE